MKKANTILVIFLLVMTIESRGQRQTNNNSLITVDVTKSYSTIKELILQDFMDVEYVALETNNEFVNQGVVMDVGKKIILVKNKINDGNIFVYNRSGKALRRINHKGQLTGKEYTNILGIVLDEDNNEMYVNDHFIRKIQVYDLYGKFKRSLNHKESSENPYYISVFNYDKDKLICYYQDNKNNRAFVLISKKDGSITHETIIPFKEKIPLTLRTNNGTQYISTSPDFYKTMIPFKGTWTLLELSSDTVYTFLPDYNLRPFLARTPPINAMNPRVSLTLNLFSDRYYFMETIKWSFDWNTGTGFPKTPFMYDKQEKVFFRYSVYNGDYSTKKEIYMNWLRPVNHEIESWQPIEAYQLVNSYKKGELKDGKLKEIAAKLDAEDNPVIMLIKHKKTKN